MKFQRISGRFAAVAAVVAGAAVLWAPSSVRTGVQVVAVRHLRPRTPPHPGAKHEDRGHLPAHAPGPSQGKRTRSIKREADFNQMVEASDDAQVMAQVGVVEAARSELNKSRTMMLLRMRRVLTPDQRVKFVMLQQQTRNHRPPR